MLLIIFNVDAHLYINVHILVFILAHMITNISLIRMLYIFKKLPLKIFTKIVIFIQVIIFNGSYVFKKKKKNLCSRFKKKISLITHLLHSAMF